MFNVNNKESRTTQYHHSGVFLVDFEYILHFFLVPDDDDYNDDVEFVVWLIGERRLPYFQPEQLTGILTIANVRHAASRI